MQRVTKRFSHRMRLDSRFLGAAVAGALLFALGCVEPTDFVSADLDSGTGPPAPEVLATAGDAKADDSAEVEEGDIYRVLDGHRILNLNTYRGLQIIDFSDLSAPEIVGRLRLDGVPVEAYVRGNRAYVLVNSWRDYSSVPFSQKAQMRDGSLVLVVDLTDPTAPTLVDRAVLPGRISVGRMVQASTRAALYVVAGAYREWEDDGKRVWEFRTHVWSFDVTGGTLTARSRLNLGGYVHAVQATTEALLVARVDTEDWRRSRVGVVDISDPTGLMVEGDEVRIEGSIRNQFALDLYEGVLRVVANDRSARLNRLYTFDVSDLTAFVPVDEVEFGDGQDLFATLFLGNKAFFVTFLRIDPFHSFEIDDEGNAREVSEFEVSGWNDFFRAVHDERRLIGIGVDTEGGFTAAVSLYDITDLSNPEPLLHRADIAGSQRWSEARWDHRAFSVLEDSVEAVGPEGQRETGLVLLPYSAYDQETHSSEQGVQIFTFSEDSLTLRGAMDHGTAVRRSFQPDADVTANLSMSTLSLFDTADPDDPTEQSRLRLNPNYSKLLLYGDHAVRVEDLRDPWGWWGWWWGPNPLDKASLQTIDLAHHPDSAPTLTEIEIPVDTRVYQVGDLLVTSRIERDDPEPRRSLEVFDLSDPTDPRSVGALELPIPPQGGYPCYTTFDRVASLSISPCFDFAPRYPEDPIVVEDALVFVEHESMSKEVGIEQVCSHTPAPQDSCWDDVQGAWIEGCSYFGGNVTCTSRDGDEPVCRGNLVRCRVNDGRGRECEILALEEVESVENCFESPIHDYWLQTRYRVVDLSTPSDPRAEAVIELSPGDRSAAGLADGSDLWVSFKRPVSILIAKPLARHFIQRIGLGDPSDPDTDDPINVPGSLVAVDGDQVFTKDATWSASSWTSSLHRLRLEDGLAHLEASRTFRGYHPNQILMDGTGHLLVSRSESSGKISLSLLDAYDDLDAVGRFEVDGWAALRLALPGRAILNAWGVQLIVNTDDPALPHLQSVVQSQGWGSQLSHLERRLFFSAGQAGIVEADLDAFDVTETAAP